MQIDTTVNEADIGKVKVGQEVDFTVDAYPDITFKGTVNQVRNSPTMVQNVVTYDVVVYVDNSDLKLKPGMTANTTIITAAKKEILRIPNAALRFVPDNEDTKKTLEKGYGVWVLKGDNPERVAIKIGISDDNYTELVEGDLKDGQGVITVSLEKDKNQPPKKMF
jgi:HlyD family secretion protein